MKKTLSILIMMLLGCGLYAGPVTPEKALQVARSVFASASSTKAVDASELQIVWDGEFEPATKSAQDPAFYVVSRPEGGFVMVAGNDNVQPVLAFSFENDFKVEGMPANVRWWMQQYKDYVRSGVSATPVVRAQWEQYAETKAKAEPVTTGLSSEFKTSRTNEWNQTNPANYYCPDVEEQTQTSVCGCVALATAEVMAWFGTKNFTSATNYVVPAYSYESENGQTVNIAEHTLNTAYDWANLKTLATTNNYYNQIKGFDGSSASYYYGASHDSHHDLTVLGESLAHLTYDIGTLLKAEYNDNANFGTGAITVDVIRAVAPVFGYNNAARYVKMDNYTSGQWEQLIKEEIEQNPIIYDGEGHAYVADGYGVYNNNLLFHFNMGWGGLDNGYYTLIHQEELEGKHSAILGFYPNHSSSVSYAALPLMGFSGKETDRGGLVYKSGYNTGTLTFDLKNFYNMGAADFIGQYYAGSLDASGQLKGVPTAIIDEVTDTMIGVGKKTWSTWTLFDLSVTLSSPVFGDQVAAFYKETGKDEYHPFFFTPKDVILPALPVFPAAAIKKKASYKTGDDFVFELTNHSYSYEDSTWKVTDPSGNTTEYDADDFSVKLTSVGDYKISCTTPGQETVVTYITVTAAP